MPRLLSAREVAEILKVRISTVYDAAERGRIPCVRLWRGRRRSLVRFREHDILQVIERGAGRKAVRRPRRARRKTA